MRKNVKIASIVPYVLNITQFVKNLPYVSKHNSIREKQGILLMIPNGDKQWHYLAVKKLSALLRGITSKHHVDFLSSELPSSFHNRNQTSIATIFATL